MAVWRRIVTALGVGYVLMFYGEVVFWMHRIEPADVLLTWVLGYTVPAYLLLWTVAHFRARTPWATFLAAAVYGWLIEGVVVQTMYDNFPLHVSWTGLAWHALLSVLIGWWWMGRLLAGRRLWPAALLAAAAGLFWGTWSIFWWVEEGTAVPPVRFGLLAFLHTGLLVPAYGIVLAARRVAFRPTRVEAAAVTVLSLAWFAGVTVPARPVALLILPPLLCLTLLALQLNRRRELQIETLDPQEEATGDRFRPVNLAALFLMPTTASLVYAAAHLADVRWQTNILVFLISVPLGFALYLVSLLMVVRAGRRCLTESSTRC